MMLILGNLQFICSMAVEVSDPRPNNNKIDFIVDLVSGPSHPPPPSDHFLQADFETQ